MCETWLTCNIPIEEVLPINDFQVHRADGPLSTTGCKRAGGVVIAVKSPYVSTKIDLCTVDICQKVLIKITGPEDFELFLIGLQNSPCKGKNSDFLSRFKSLLKHVHDAPSIIAGDFNENALDTPKPIQKMLTEKGFQQRVTQVTDSQGACLDHIYTRHIQNVTTSVSAAYYSDHRWTSCKFQI